MIGKLLCAMALAIAALAQDIRITSPAPGAKLPAGSSFVIQLTMPKQTTDDSVHIEVAGTPCLAGCPDEDVLGHFGFYSGPFDPNGVNSNGEQYQNITATVPNAFQGTMAINAANFVLKGMYNTAALQFTRSTATVTGASG